MRTYAMRTHWVRRHHYTGKKCQSGFQLAAETSPPNAELLLYSEDRVLRRLGDSEFNDGLGWNLDLLLCPWVEAGASLPLLLHQLAKPRQDEFTGLFNLFICECAERIEEYSRGSFVGLSGSSKGDLKFSFGHV